MTGKFDAKCRFYGSSSFFFSLPLCSHPPFSYKRIRFRASQVGKTSELESHPPDLNWEDSSHGRHLGERNVNTAWISSPTFFFFCPIRSDFDCLRPTTKMAEERKKWMGPRQSVFFLHFSSFFRVIFFFCLKNVRALKLEAAPFFSQSLTPF